MLQQWVVVIPVKELALAKTRLVDLSPDARVELALAGARDVLAAALHTAAVAAVYVVTNDVRAATTLAGEGAQVVADTADSGLNPALAGGARIASGWHPRAGIAALSSDLPALASAELGAALTAATDADRCFVADHQGSGTTLLTALPGVMLAPLFGASSRQHHLTSGAVELAGVWPGLRRDVDTQADLVQAARGPIGVHTAMVLTRLGLAG